MVYGKEGIKMIKVYRINDYEWWATKTGLEAIISEWEKITGEKYEEDLPYPEECNLETDGLWNEIPYNFGDTVIPLIQNQNKNTVGDRKMMFGEYCEYVSFKDVIEHHYKDFGKPFCIACTEV